MAVVTNGLVGEWIAKLAKNGTAPGENSTPTTTWKNTGGTGDITLDNAGTFAWTTSSGWAGAGTVGDPYKLVLDGVNDHGHFPNGQFNYAQLTFEMWVQQLATGSVSSTVVIGNVDDATGLNGNNFTLAAGETRMSASWKYSGGTWYPGSGVGQFSGSSFLHVVLTYDGTTARLYNNGSTYSTPQTTGYLPNSGLGSRLGQWTGTGGGASFGLATLRIYNRALSGTEVTQNYNAGILASSLDLTPTVTTSSITDITASTATGGGTITSQGSSAVTAYGVCWNTTGTPTIDDSHTTQP